ncbi:MAG: toxin-antitoxin system YwqK family antitoxin [Leptospiraceae bacterium]|nr:toxin-antitoxin system YwqK family antitoxin [Leptospiraceae bacterium]
MRSLHRALFILAIILSTEFFGCDRLSLPPRPESIPDGATYDRRRDQWNYSKDSEVRQYYENGNLLLEGQMDGGSRIGTWNWYAPDGKTLTTTGVYRNGRRDGLWKHFDDSGRLYLTIEYKPEPLDPVIGAITIDYGNENGPYHRYYPDGTLEEKGSMVAGKKDGAMNRFFPDGGTMIQGQYEDGKKIGKWVYYHFSGTIVRLENYKAGLLDGTVKTFHANGLPYSETEYSSGKEVRGPVVENSIEAAYAKKPWPLSPGDTRHPDHLQ